MPQRPRAHQIEDESRNAFREALPAAWIVRELAPDYGLDQEVEIVSEDGRVTGQRFSVQLKATESNATSIRLSADVCRYYRGLSSPILLVLYRVGGPQLRAVWFHAVDRAFGEEQVTVTFELGSESVWSDQTPRRLEEGVAAYRFFKSPGLALPLRFLVETTQAELFGMPSAELTRRAMAAAREESGVISFGSSSHGARIEVSGTEVSVSLGAVASVTFGLEASGSDADSFAFDVLVACALVLAKINQFELAARIAHRFAGRSALIADGTIVVQVAEIMRRAHRPTEALDVVDELLNEHPERAGMSVYLVLTALGLANIQSETERARYACFMERQIERAEEKGDEHEIAIAHYNLANHLRGKGSSKAAFRHYRLALQIWPRYGDYEYFNREIAGVLYMRGRYRLAAVHYQRAREIGSDWPMKGLHGDALMFGGRYREALALFREAVEEPDQANVEWSLKNWFLENVIEGWGADDQQRDMRAAEALAEEISRDLTGEEARAALHAALRSDWLSGLLWFNLGVLNETQLSLHEEALFSFLACGICQPGDVEAWINAIFIAANLGEGRADAALIEAAATHAYFANGDELLEQVSRMAREQPEGFPVAEFINAIEALIRGLQPVPQSAPDAEVLPAGHERLTLLAEVEQNA